MLLAAGVCLAQEVRLDAGRVVAKGRGELAVYVAGMAAAPAVLGESQIEGDSTVFHPRFPLQPGVKYRVVFRAAGFERVAELEPPASRQPPARVEAIYPSAGVWPENELKFYIHFSAPMSRGEVYRRVTLLEENGAAVDAPFLELEQELWDPGGKRITVLFDPGRVKRDLKPHRDAGSPLVQGRTYTLVVDAGWPDAAGRPLAAGARKTIRVGPPDRDPVDLRKWTIRPPRPGTLDPVEVNFGEPLDRALAERVLEVAGRRGLSVEGRVEVDREETRWRFWPLRPWAAGDYSVRVERILEDLAGNSVGKRFEVDVFEKVADRVAREVESVPFRVR